MVPLGVLVLMMPLRKAAAVPGKRLSAPTATTLPEARPIRRTALVLSMLLMASVLAGCAAVAGSDDTFTIQTQPYRIGDARRLTWNESWWEEGTRVDDRYETLLHFEGRANVADKFGIQRDTIEIYSETWYRDEVAWATRCYLLEGGTQGVREEAVGQGTKSQFDRVPGVVGVTYEDGGSTWFGSNCLTSARFAGRTFHEGSVLTGEELEETDTWYGLSGDSTPAVRTTHEGRDALRFTFRTEGPGDPVDTYFVVADGIPGFAAAGLTTTEYDYHEAVVGYTPGAGSALVDRGARIPDVRPGSTTTPLNPLTVDHAAWTLAFPFDEALRAIQASPREPLSQWLARHPRAAVTHAFYRDADTTPEADPLSDGTWWIGFSDGTDAMLCSITRIGATATGVKIPQQLKPTSGGCGTEDFPLPVFKVDTTKLPASLISTHDLAATAATAGVPGEKVINFRYFVYDTGSELRPFYVVDDMTRYEAPQLAAPSNGTFVGLDARTGGATWIMNSTRTSNMLSIVAANDIRPAASADTGRTPAEALSIAGAGAGAVVIGGVLLKLLVALFTRLAAAQILENPVRARLYERIRAEPGIHREELIDFAGIGNGATRHHLQKLTKHGYALEISAGGFARYYPAGEVPIEVARRHAFLETGRAREVYELYATQPTISLREAAQQLGMSAPGVHRVRKRLQRQGLLAAS